MAKMKEVLPRPHDPAKLSLLKFLLGRRIRVNMSRVLNGVKTGAYETRVIGINPIGSEEISNSVNNGELICYPNSKGNNTIRIDIRMIEELLPEDDILKIRGRILFDSATMVCDLRYHVTHDHRFTFQHLMANQWVDVPFERIHPETVKQAVIDLIKKRYGTEGGSVVDKFIKEVREQSAAEVKAATAKGNDAPTPEAPTPPPPKEVEKGGIEKLFPVGCLVSVILKDCKAQGQLITGQIGVVHKYKYPDNNNVTHKQVLLLVQFPTIKGTVPMFPSEVCYVHILHIYPLLYRFRWMEAEYVVCGTFNESVLEACTAEEFDKHNGELLAIKKNVTPQAFHYNSMYLTEPVVETKNTTLIKT